MNEQNITIEINAEVKVNGVVVPDAQVKILSSAIEQETELNSEKE